MSTATEVRYEFRCTNCYQSLLVPVETAGSTIDCPWCQKSVTAPEATEQRVQRGEEVEEDAGAVTEVGMFAETQQVSREELAKLAKQRSQASRKHSPGRCTSPEKMGASRFRRLIAVIVDGIVDLVMFVLTGVFVFVLAIVGLLDFSEIKIDPVAVQLDPSGALLSLPWQFLAAGLLIPALVISLQWYLISTRGQSIGKMLLSIKIVDSAGNPPGFNQGVILRNGSRTLWNYIPAFAAPFVAAGLLPYISAAVSIGAFVNILFICLSPPRCLHDHIAGTYVVDA